MLRTANIRLTHKEIQHIRNIAKEIFGQKTQIILFGSRVDKHKKGGDIDLYIIPENKKNIFEKKLKYLVKLKSKIGEQKIDLIIERDKSRDIEKEALRNGVEL